MQVIDQFTPYDVIDFFKCLGIYPKSKNGYIYPNSEQASSVLDVLRLELSHQKVALFTQTIVKGIEKMENNSGFQQNRTNLLQIH